MSRSPIILGVSAYYHDSAACLMAGGEIVAAAQEERFTRLKHDQSFPHHAVAYCLEEAGLRPGDLEHVVFYDKPFTKFERLLETYLAFAPKGFRSFATSMPIWLKDKLFQKSVLVDELKDGLSDEIDWRSKLSFSEHHLSHAASAFFPSPFENAAVLTMDGVGEWATTSLAVGAGKSLTMQREIRFPHSIGLLYSSFTYYLGFKVNSGEYKVMGLAPYGTPKYKDLILDNIVAVRDDGSFHLDMSYFDYCTGLTMTNRKFAELFGGPPRSSESGLAQREMDIAASVQAVTEEVVLRLARNIARETGEKNLCLAGGVALNCVANGLVLRDGCFENVWVQPASGDAGGALGAALVANHLMLDQPRAQLTSGLDQMQGAYLGPAFSDEDAAEELTAQGAVFKRHGNDTIIELTAKALAEGRAVGWMSGRMEFGPRALGGRSILADPRSPEMQRNLNLKIKFRESFRPFAPSVLREKVSEWFDLSSDSPYMLLTTGVAQDKRRDIDPSASGLDGIDKLKVIRSEIPAVTHVDCSARVQTVHAETNPRYHALISKFEDLTGCPVLVNTSFNVRGEPIVCTPGDAFRCFMGTELDLLVVGNLILYKERQDPSLLKTYEGKYELD